MATANELDLSGFRQMRTQISEGGQSETGSNHGGKTPGPSGAVPKDRERKIGHRRVDEKTGTVTYKKKTTSELMAAIQLGIGQSVGGLSSKPERDLLMQDFGVVQSVVFPSEGSNMTPAHHCSDFRFKTYAPMAFRFFRELFNIRPDDFMLSLCDASMTELSNPGAGGSIFYISADDEFIIKTAQHKEANFLQKLLPGYYMENNWSEGLLKFWYKVVFQKNRGHRTSGLVFVWNPAKSANLNLNQNPRTLLPKFYGLYCYQCGGKNIRFVIMNNMLPSVVKMHEKYDLKGSTFKRKASKSERAKSSPTLKDLDFMDLHPEGLMLEKDTYDALVKTIQRDCRVLESFKIMDYSMLVGIHNLDIDKKEKAIDSARSNDTSILGQSDGLSSSIGTAVSDTPDGKNRGLARGKSMRAKLTQYSTPMESIQAEVRDILEEFDDEDIPPGGIPAKNAKGERLLLYLGIIDILQCYRFRKKFEHTFKSMITDGDTISVTRPSFYSERFQKFFTNTVFKKAPSPLKHSPSKRKPGERGPRTQSMNEDIRDPHITGTTGARPDLLIDSSTPPPAFSEVIAGARPRTQTSPLPTIRGSETDLPRSERALFQTIPQQDDVLRSPSNLKMRHSPVSVSESTPTFTEFTEGTPSYTASSPSCSSDVLDTQVPNLPMDSANPSVDNSPSKTMATNSSTDASYYSAVSSIETDARSDPSLTGVLSRSDERLNNARTVTMSDVTTSKTSERITHHETSAVTVEKTTIEISANSPPKISVGSGSYSEPCDSVISHKSADTSFESSVATSVDGGFTESYVSSRTTSSEQSYSINRDVSSGSDVTKMADDNSGIISSTSAQDEITTEIEESTYL